MADVDLNRLDDLTRRYAEASRDAAGLATLWGGLVLLGVCGLSCLQGYRCYGGALARGELARPGGLANVLLTLHPVGAGFAAFLVLSPLLCFAGWGLLRAWTQGRFGRVIVRAPGLASPTFRSLAELRSALRAEFSRPWSQRWDAMGSPQAVLSIGVLLMAAQVFVVIFVEAARHGRHQAPTPVLTLCAALALPVLGSVLLWVSRKECMESASILCMLTVLAFVQVYTGISGATSCVALGFALSALGNMGLGVSRFLRYRRVMAELQTNGGTHEPA